MEDTRLREISIYRRTDAIGCHLHNELETTNSWDLNKIVLARILEKYEGISQRI